MARLILCNVIVLVVLWIGRSRRISPYSPLMLSAFVWQAVFVSGLFFGDKFYPLTDRALVMWASWFLVSSAFYLLLDDRSQTACESRICRQPFDYTYILLGLLLWLAYQIRVVGNAGPSQFLLNLRLSSNQFGDYETLGFVGRFYPWVFALFLFEHANAHGGNRRLRVLLWCWMLLYAFATMGKFAILTPVLAWAVIKGVRGQLPMRGLLFLVPLLFGLMVALQFLRSGSGEHVRFGEFVSLYIYSPIVALGYSPSPVDAPFGAHTFRFLYALNHSILGGVAPVQIIQNYVAIPHLTNVYTAMQPFVVDFGMVGILFGAAAYGMFFGVFFHAAKAHRQLPLIIYAGLSVVLVGQFIGEFLFTMFSGNLQFIIAAIVITYNSRRVDLVR